MDHYANLNRMCVFSHDELVCKIAAAADQLEIEVASATRDDLQKMVDRETEMRKTTAAMGVTEYKREIFELIPDDERQCSTCRTTCFMSALKCPCSISKTIFLFINRFFTTEKVLIFFILGRLVCSKHVKVLCSCSPTKYCLRLFNF